MDVFTFGPFRLEPGERRLWREGERVELDPKAFDLLVMLVERAGHLVTKDELLEQVWPDAVVEEGALTVQVSRLRAALGESARQWRYVETVPRAGYRFAAVVQREPMHVEPVTGPEARHRWLRLAALAGGVGVLGIALVALGGREGAPPAARATAVADSVERISPSAQEAYARGREIWWTRHHLDRALRQFRIATVLDSTFALAHVGAADVYAMGYQSADEARASLRRALALNPDLAEAHATLGLVRMLQEWDWDGAAETLDHARRLAPEYAPAHQWTATLQMLQGEHEEALLSLDRALQAAPHEARPVLLADRCQALYLARRFDDAAEACRVAMESATDVPFASQTGFWALALADRPADAVRWSHTHDETIQQELGAIVPSDVDPNRLRRRLLAGVDRRDPHVSLDWSARAVAYAGDRERALSMLEHAVEVRHFFAPFLAVDPVFDDLRDEPRFQAAVARIGL